MPGITIIPLEKDTSIYPRSVREILHEVVDSQKITTYRDFIQTHILPWINTEAVANEMQEQALKNTRWNDVGDNRFQFILMLQTLRG
ncbi:MAG: hypothetical protein HYT94_04025 [Parcubacteria group bacterium]|nr:hypothetical protein [Parcubacteria group bacterium]